MSEEGPRTVAGWVWCDEHQQPHVDNSEHAFYADRPCTTHRRLLVGPVIEQPQETP